MTPADECALYPIPAPTFATVPPPAHPLTTNAMLVRSLYRHPFISQACTPHAMASVSIKASRRSLASSSTHGKASRERDAKSGSDVPATRQADRKTDTRSLSEEDERVRQLLLDRDGGPASVPTRAGNWDSEMGRETSRQMFRVLDQTRQARPGTQQSMGETESKGWSRRNY